MKKYEKGIIIIDNAMKIEKMVEQSNKKLKPYPCVLLSVQNLDDLLSLTIKDANLLIKKIQNKEAVIIGMNGVGEYDELLDNYEFT